MVFNCAPVTALAVDDSTVAAVTIGGTTTEYSDFKEAIDAVDSAEEATVTLYKDVEIEYTISLKEGQKITVYGNGKTITGRDSTYYATFFLWDNSELVLDNVIVRAGKDVQAVNVYEESACLTLQNGTELYAEDEIALDLDGKLIFTGGKISSQIRTIEGRANSEISSPLQRVRPLKFILNYRMKMHIFPEKALLFPEK